MEGSPLKALLAPLDRAQLEALLLELAAGDRQIEAAITQATLRRARQGATVPEPPRLPPLDLRAFRREAQAIFRGGDEYGYAGGITAEVAQLVAQAQARTAAGDANTALALLDAITEAYTGGWYDFDDSDGEMGNYLQELGAAWIEPLLSATLTPRERESWIEKLEGWDQDVAQYGVDDAFAGAIEAARQGWEHPPLQAILRGADAEPGSLAGDPAALTVARLNILERQGRYQEALNLGRAADQIDRYTTLLVRLDRVQEAVDFARVYLGTAAEALALARALRERGELDHAVAIAEQGLALPANRVSVAGQEFAVPGARRDLAAWLCDLAMALGRRDVALEAATVVFQEELSLDAYSRVAELAGERWPERRDALLDRLRRVRSYYPQGPVDIFLHEGLIEDAIAAVAGGATHTLVERVADAAVATNPEWVIDVSRAQAESIMDAGKAQYYAAAAGWLGRMRDAYRAQGQEATWSAYKAELLQLHGRKYKLVPMIKALR